MSRIDAQMKIRLPADLKNQLESIAKENRRSLNAEIIDRLQESLSFETMTKPLEVTNKDAIFKNIDRDVAGASNGDTKKILEVIKLFGALHIATTNEKTNNLLNKFKAFDEKMSFYNEILQKYDSYLNQSADDILNTLKGIEMPNFTQPPSSDPEA